MTHQQGLYVPTGPKADFYGPTHADVVFLAGQDAKRADIFRDKNGNELVLFYHNLISLEEKVRFSIYRSACINLLIAELERYLEDPTTPRMHIFQECAQQAHFDIRSIREFGVKARDEPTMALIDSRIESVSAAVRSARELYAQYEDHKLKESKQRLGDRVYLSPTTNSPSHPGSGDLPQISSQQYIMPTSIAQPEIKNSLTIPRLIVQGDLELEPESLHTRDRRQDSLDRPDTPTTMAHYRQSSAVNLNRVRANSNGMRRTVSSIAIAGLGLVDLPSMQIRDDSTAFPRDTPTKQPIRAPTAPAVKKSMFESDQPPSRVGTPDDLSSKLTASWGLSAPRRIASVGGFHARTGSFLDAGMGVRPPSRMGTPFSTFFGVKQDGDIEDKQMDGGW